MLPRYAGALRRPIVAPPSDASDFYAPFDDLGAGEANLVLTRGTGSATFTRATAATTVLSTGLIGDVATGVARSRYDPASLTYQGYFGEQSATNVCLQSEDFETTWAAIGSVTITGATDTCGVVSLSTLDDSSAAELQGVSQAITFTGNAVKSLSLFFKQGTSSSSVIRLRDESAGADRLLAAITWSGGVPTVTMTTGTLLQTAGPFGASGVYRAEMLTTSATAANTNRLELYPATDAALDVGGTGTIICGGVMACNEANSKSFSYIKTTTASVTRNSDALSYTSDNISASEGTVYAECSVTGPGTTSNCFFIDGGSFSAGGLIVYGGGGAALTTIAMDDGPTLVTKTGLTSLLTGVRKRASRWGGSTMSITGDGATVETGTFDGAMTATSVRIGVANSCQCVKEVNIWLTDQGDAFIESETA